MFKNYIKIAWRNLWKNKGYSFLNIFGLAIGITCAAVILLWVEDELSFNTTFDKQDHVYYVPTNQQYEGEWRTFFQATPGPLAKVLKDEIPEIIASSRTKGADFLFEVGESSISKYGRYADPDFLSMFSLSFIEGSRENALKNTDGIVISERTARAIYGENTPVLGKTIQVNDNEIYTITGVFKNLPINVTYDFDWIASFEKFAVGKEWVNEYDRNFSDTFIELSPKADFASVNAKVKKVLPEKTEDEETYAFLHPMKDWHLRANFEGGKKVGGQITYVRLFSLIAIIVLLIACINFMNLSTARSEKRANEVGVRKVLGSGKRGLISQFMAEAIITATLATIVSVILLYVIIPQFNVLINKELAIRLFEPTHLLSLIAITILCGVIAGWYPAFYLSSFKPVEVLKGASRKQGSAPIIRKGLVATQFVVSIVFIISTIIVYQQVQHVKGRDLGYDRNNLVKLPVNGNVIKNFEGIKADMLASGQIENLGLVNSEVLSGGNNTSGLEWQGGLNTEDVLVSYRNITPDFFDTTGMQIIEGRGFNANAIKDSTSLIVSESFARLMGPGSAIGKTIETDYYVVGVVKDYVYGDMYGTGDPVIFFNQHDDARFMYVKAKANSDIGDVLVTMAGVLEKYNPAFPFEYEFVDDAFSAKFKSEKLIGSLSQLFALLAILISCLGLFGLSAFTAEQRRKEIGVRKVLGSSISGIVGLLSKDFIQLILVATLIACPIAWYMMETWLEGYAYRIQINWMVFIVSGLVAIAIALLTVSYQAVKAASVNPVKSLRTE